MKTTLYMLPEQSSSQMMSYIMQTKEGNLIVKIVIKKSSQNEIVPAGLYYRSFLNYLFF